MTKKYLLIAAITLALAITFSHITTLLTNIYFAVKETPKNSDLVLLIVFLTFEIAAITLLIVALLAFIKDIKVNQQWRFITRLVIIGVAISVISVLTYGSISLHDTLEALSLGSASWFETEKDMAIMNFCSSIILLIAIIALTALSIIYERKERIAK